MPVSRRSSRRLFSARFSSCPRCCFSGGGFCSSFSMAHSAWARAGKVLAALPGGPTSAASCSASRCASSRGVRNSSITTTKNPLCSAELHAAVGQNLLCSQAAGSRPSAHNHSFADSQIEFPGDRAAVDGKFQKTAGARYGDELSGRHGLVKRLKRKDPFAFYTDSAGIPGQREERCIVDIGYRVAEAVDVSDLAFDGIRGTLRLRPAQFDQLLYRATDFPQAQTLAQVRGNRREDVASVKGVADRAQEELRIRDLMDGLDSFTRQSQRQHAVVGPDKQVIDRLDHNGSASAANTRINDGDVHRPLREKPVTGG